MGEEQASWRWTIRLVVTLTIVALALPFVLVRAGSPVRDRHGQAALETPISEVAVVAAGRLFHDPRCPFIHGRPAIESTAAARAQGYIPCPRCLGHLLKRSSDRRS